MQVGCSTTSTDTTFTEPSCFRKHCSICALDIAARGVGTGVTKTVGLGDDIPGRAMGLDFGELAGRGTEGVGDSVASGVGVGVGLAVAMDRTSPFFR